MPDTKPILTIPNRDKLENSVNSIREVLRNLTGKSQEPDSGNITNEPILANQPQITPTVPVQPNLPLLEQGPAANIATPSQLNITPVQQASTQPVQNVPSQAGLAGQGTLSDIGAKSFESLQQGIELQKAGAQKSANAIQRMNQEAEQEAIALRRKQDQIDHDLMKETEERNAKIGEASAKLETMRTNLAQAKVDPDRFFGGDTGKRILAGIAIAFGEFGRALTGGRENTALSIINKAIDDDINAQKEDISNKQTQILLARQGLADIKDLYKDRIEAQQAQKIMAIEMSQAKVNEIARRYNTQEAMAKAQIINGQLEVQKGELLGKYFDAAASSGKKLDNATTQAEDNLRAEREKSDEYKKTVARRDAVSVMEAAQQEKSGAGDIALIFSYMKSLDPGSTVMQGEYANAENAAGVNERVRAVYNKALSGQKVSDATKAEFVKSAKSILAASEKTLARKDAGMLDIAKRRGLNPDNIFINRTPEPVTPGKYTSLTIEGEPAPQQKTKTANVMPGR